MTHSPLFKTLSSSMFMAAMVYAPSAYANEAAVSDDKYLDERDITNTLVELQRKDIDVGKTAPTSNISEADAQKAISERGKPKVAQRYDLEALKADPVAFTKYLNAALAAQDMATVKELLPHYKELQVNDPMLINFADALVYRSEGKNNPAIEIYKKMLAENPDFHPVRLNMAQALYADKQYAVAKDQLQKLRGADIPQPVMASVDRLIERINDQEQWRFNASVSYVQEDNLNGVPEKQIQINDLNTGGNPESGKGLQASLGANKRINLDKNFYAEVGGSAFLKGYWDNSDYNDYLLTASAGVGYDDAKNDVSISPFITKRYFGEEAYSVRDGVTIKASRWVKPKLKLTATGIVSNEEFDDSKDKNRETDGLFLGLNALYIKDAKEYFYGGVGRYENDVPKAKILTYDRDSVNVGWGREWNKGISTLTTLGYGVKEYEKGFASNFGGKPGSAREDKTTSLGFQVWKRDLTVLGLTPRLVFDYDKTSSNFKYYDDRDETTATVMLTKTF